MIDIVMSSNKIVAIIGVMAFIGENMGLAAYKIFINTTYYGGRYCSGCGFRWGYGVMSSRCLFSILHWELKSMLLVERSYPTM